MGRISTLKRIKKLELSKVRKNEWISPDEKAFIRDWILGDMAGPPREAHLEIITVMAKFDLNF